MPSITVYTALLNYQLLEQYEVTTGLATGVYKPNLIGDPDYVAPIESDLCPVRVTKWIGAEPYCEQNLISWDSSKYSFDSTVITFDNQDEQL